MQFILTQLVITACFDATPLEMRHFERCCSNLQGAQNAPRQNGPTEFVVYRTRSCIFSHMNDIPTHNRYFVGTYEARPGAGADDYMNPSTEYPPGSHQGDTPMGTLTSEIFTLGGDGGTVVRLCVYACTMNTYGYHHHSSPLAINTELGVSNSARMTSIRSTRQRFCPELRTRRVSS